MVMQITGVLVCVVYLLCLCFPSSVLCAWPAPDPFPLPWHTRISHLCVVTGSRSTAALRLYPACITSPEESVMQNKQGC